MLSYVSNKYCYNAPFLSFIQHKFGKLKCKPHFFDSAFVMLSRQTPMCLWPEDFLKIHIYWFLYDGIPDAAFGF